ncbi:MAG: hypothetical protein ACI86X_001058 [Moritella sp.]|jgi:hypothetical protein
MSNSTDKLNPANRAMLVSAILGGTASAANQWCSHQDGKLDTNQLVSQVVKDAAKAGLAGGAATHIAERMAGRPILSMLTLLSAGAAGLYLLDQCSGKDTNEK